MARTLPRIMASFHPQRDEGKYIVPAGESVPFDVTDTILAMDMDDLLNLRDDTEETDRLAELCPARRAHDGPFTVCIEVVLDDWLAKLAELVGHSDSMALTNADLARAMEFLVAAEPVPEPHAACAFAFVLRCPSGNHWRSVIRASGWDKAVRTLAADLVGDVGADAKRWYVEHALDGAGGELAFLPEAALNDFSAAVETELKTLTAGA